MWTSCFKVDSLRDGLSQVTRVDEQTLLQVLVVSLVLYVLRMSEVSCIAF